MNIDVDISGALNKINQFEKEYKIKLEKKLFKAANFVRNYIEDNISYSRDYKGRKLKDNAKSTAIQKGFNKPLIHTDGLRTGLKALKTGDLEYEISFTDKANLYARVHHRGVSDAGKKHNIKIPARPVMGVSSILREKIKQIVNG
jgi:phage gpG-like protein